MLLLLNRSSEMQGGGSQLCLGQGWSGCNCSSSLSSHTPLPLITLHIASQETLLPTRSLCVPTQRTGSSLPVHQARAELRKVAGRRVDKWGIWGGSGWPGSTQVPTSQTLSLPTPFMENSFTTNGQVSQYLLMPNTFFCVCT